MEAQLAKRLTSSAVLVSITIATIFLAPQWLFLLVVEIIVLLASNEFLSLAEKKGITLPRVFYLVITAIIPITFYFSSESVGIMLACLLFFISYFRPGYRDQALLGTAVALFGIVYVACFFSYLIKIRAYEHGPSWVFYVILMTKMGDAGAYFTGKKYGKHKLIEHISPNKSVEGAVGGFLTTVIVSLVSKMFLPHVAFGHLLIMGVLVAIFSQLGDLGESLLKRDAGVKDSGTIPGLGGVLDVLDSLLLTIPFVYCYISTWNL